jgi:hypothetical protein
LQAKIKYGNKWSEISRQMNGRTEIMLKNRFNYLYKNYKDFNRKLLKESLNEALKEGLHTVSDDNKWICNLINEKKEMIKSSDIKPKAQEIGLNLLEATRNEIIENSQYYTCPNFRYRNRIRERETNIIRNSEKFTNSATNQEIFIGSEGIFIYNTEGCNNFLVINNFRFGSSYQLFSNKEGET